MDVKLNALINAKEGFEVLLDLDLPIKTSYRVTKIVKIVNEEFQIYEEKRSSLVKKYGGEVEEEVNGNIEKIFKVLPENMSSFIEDHNELVSVDVSLDFEPLKLSDLGDVKVKPKYLYMLGDFILSDE